MCPNIFTFKSFSSVKEITNPVKKRTLFTGCPRKTPLPGLQRKAAAWHGELSKEKDNNRRNFFTSCKNRKKGRANFTQTP